MWPADEVRGESGEEERKEARGMRWAGSEDDEGQEIERERQQEEGKKEPEQEGERDTEAEEKKEQEKEKETRQETEQEELWKGRERERDFEERKRNARGAPERFREEREVVRSVHDECVKEKGGDEHDRMSDHKDVSNRHMTWWRNARWIRVDNGPHLRTAQGR